MIFPDINQAIPGSKYFKWKEALWLPTFQAFAAIPNEQVKLNIIKQAAQLDKVRDYFNRPLIIHCWYRPEIYNSFVMGAKASAHLEGLATDFHVEGRKCEEVKAALQTEGNKVYEGRGEINTRDWVHLDLRPGPWFIV